MMDLTIYSSSAIATWITCFYYASQKRIGLLSRNFCFQHKDIHRFTGIAPKPTATGDIGSMVMYAGQSVGLITEIIPAGEVVRRLVAEAKDVIRERLSDFQ